MSNMILKAAIRRLKHQFTRKKRFLEYPEIKRVLLFFNREHLDASLSVIQTLEADGKHVFALCFDDVKNRSGKPHDLLPQPIRQWNKSDLNVFSIPRKVRIKEISTFEADSLIDLTLRPSLMHDFLYFHTKAVYRAGFNRRDPGQYDLLLAVDDGHDAAFFFSQLLFYMKSLRTRG